MGRARPGRLRATWASVDSIGRGQMNLNFFPPDLPNAWLLSAQVTNAAGQQPSGAMLGQQCPQLLAAQTGNGALPTAIHSCIKTLAKTFRQDLPPDPRLPASEPLLAVPVD